MIVEDNAIAAVLTETAWRRCHRSKEGIVSRSIRAVQGRSRLIKDLDRGIGGQDVMARSNIAMGVGRKATASALRRTHPIKGSDRRRHGCWRRDLPRSLHRIVSSLRKSFRP